MPDFEPILPPEPPLSDGVIALRPFVPNDAPVVHANLDDDGVRAYLSIPLDQTLEGTARFLASCATGMSEGTSAVFAIADAATGELVGSIGVDRSADDAAIGIIGYWLFAASRGRGLMTRALALLTRWAFAELGFARLQLTVHEDNLASIRVAEKAGFRREGLLRGIAEQRGRRVDLLMFGRLASDPEPESGDARR